VTPAVLAQLGLDIEWGRTLSASDDRTPLLPVLLPADLASWIHGRLQVAGQAARAVGVLSFAQGRAAAQNGSLTMLAPLSRAPAGVCPETGLLSLGVLSLPPDVDATLATIARAIGQPPLQSRYDVISAPGTEKLWSQLTGLTRTVGALVSLIVTLLATLTVTAMLAVRFEARRFEHGVARAVGASLSDLSGELLLESSTLGLAGVAIGVIPVWVVLSIAAAHWQLIAPLPLLAAGSTSLALMMIIGISLAQIRSLRREPPVVGLGAVE